MPAITKQPQPPTEMMAVGPANPASSRGEVVTQQPKSEPLPTLQQEEDLNLRGGAFTMGCNCCRGMFSFHKRSIRLLDLDDASSSPESLSGTLRAVELPDISSAYLISDPESTRTYKLELTSNCHAALLQIRKLFGTTPIWVDAVGLFIFASPGYQRLSPKLTGGLGFSRLHGATSWGVGHNSGSTTQPTGQATVVSRALDGIRAALRERVSSRPHDKSFCVSGILKALGANPSEPDYTRTPLQTYATFLADLFAWNRESIIMLIDAGGPASEHHTATWIPDWTRPRPSAWLTARYRWGDILHPPRWVTSQFAISDKLTMRLKGKRLGSVVSCTTFHSIDDLKSDLETTMTGDLNLDLCLRWQLSVLDLVTKYEEDDMIEGYMLAVLEGLTLPRRSSSVARRSTRGKLGPESIPFDFRDRVNAYRPFCRLTSQLHNEYGNDEIARLRSSLWIKDGSSDERDAHYEMRYLAGVTRNLPREKRNLFIMSGPQSILTGLCPGSEAPMEQGTAKVIIIVLTPWEALPPSQWDKRSLYNCFNA
ncbi:hypothetical protein QBC35DRAFT_545193 [Podospora australis]|uniref:Heterokaryon incompatibility domain-containing protein n=1 Tax=Podospora australis TaxID=1536484 RepID=A0AAN7AKS0_9PEZI|nr:hypothetical protein QBC35DRAFT_545193 [Podospora australis]